MNNYGVPRCGTILIRRHSRHRNYSLFIIHYSLAQRDGKPVPHIRKCRCVVVGAGSPRPPTIILQITLLVFVKWGGLYSLDNYNPNNSFFFASNSSCVMTPLSNNSLYCFNFSGTESVFVLTFVSC